MLIKDPERYAGAPPPGPATPPAVSRRPARRRLRRSLVGVHRWASLVLTLWVCLMAITGSILVFRDRIIGWQSPGLFAHGTGDVGAARVVAAAKVAEPKLTVTGFTTPAVSDGVYVVSMSSDGEQPRRQAVYVDPATAAVNGTRDPTEGIVPTAQALHEHLLVREIGPVRGETLVGWFAVGWLVILLTGAYLWWGPRLRRRGPVLRVRRGRGRLAFHLDLHKAAGVVALVPLTLIVLTGINLVWPEVTRPVYEAVTRSGSRPVYQVPRSVKSKDSGGDPLDPAALVAAASRVMPDDGLITSVNLPAAKDRTGTVRVRLSSGWDPRRGPTGAGGNVQLNLDQYSGEVLYRGDPADFPVAAQAYDTWANPVHTGTFAGTPSRVAWLAVAAAPVVLAGTGVVMWSTRRGRRSAGRGGRRRVAEPAATASG
jgi:uncharacterized iron-regulated membrane protein